jgi:hypothetical protein
MVFISVIKCMGLSVLYGRCRYLGNVYLKCFANSYAGAFSQVIIILMGVFGLCNFIVAWRLGGVEFMFVLVYLYMVSFCMVLLCISVCIMFFVSAVFYCY